MSSDRYGRIAATAMLQPDKTTLVIHPTWPMAKLAMNEVTEFLYKSHAPYRRSFDTIWLNNGHRIIFACTQREKAGGLMGLRPHYEWRF